MMTLQGKDKGKDKEKRAGGNEAAGAAGGFGLGDDFELDDGLGLGGGIRGNGAAGSIGMFSFCGRASRREFVKILGAVLFFEVVSAFSLKEDTSIGYAVAILMICLALNVGVIPMTVRRLHDSDLNGTWFFLSVVASVAGQIASFFSKLLESWAWWAAVVFMIVSFVAGTWTLYYLLRAGSAGENYYGAPDPKKSYTDSDVNRFCVGLIVVAVVLAIVQWNV